MKVMGHAILDELFILIFSVQKSFRPPLVGDFILLLIPSTILISTFFSILNNPVDILFKLNLAVTGICILCICLVRNFSFDISKIAFAGLLYLFLNILFVVIEQSAVIFKFNLGCQNNFDSFLCLLPPAFWQDYWTGTAYSALGIWVSFLAITSSRFSIFVKILALLGFLLIVSYQSSKTGFLFLILSLFLILLKFSPAQRIKLYISFAILILLDIVFTFWINNRTTLPANSTYFQEFYNQVVNLELWVHGHFLTRLHVTLKEIPNHWLGLVDFFQSFLDVGRKEQISGIFNWLQSTDLKGLFFGNLSGSHRTGIPNEIPVDKSLVLRPIGIVAWAYDWGVIFLVSYLLIVVQGIRVIQRKIREFDLHYVFFVVYVLFYLLVASLPLITNITSSVLFWIIIFHSGCVISAPIKETKKAKNA